MSVVFKLVYALISYPGNKHTISINRLMENCFELFRCKIPLQTLSVNQLVILLVVGHMIVVSHEIHFWLLKNKAKYDYWFCFIKYATWIILPLPLGSCFKTPPLPFGHAGKPTKPPLTYDSNCWHEPYTKYCTYQTFTCFHFEISI